jgi:P4 family phage/plasmid primase-like protien
MSFNKYLTNKKFETAQTFIHELGNRNAEDYFFNKSDLDKMAHFKDLTDNYKLCNKTYYYFNPGNKLWVEEKTEDSVINRICDYTRIILEPEQKFVNALLTNKLLSLTKKDKDDLSKNEKDEIDSVKSALQDFTKFINKEIKEHMKAKFAKSVLNFFHHQIIDPDFMEKININNHHLLPLKYANLDLTTLTMKERVKQQYFTQCLDFFDLNDLTTNDDTYKIVDKFFLDIATGHEAKKIYLQKIMGYFLSGNVDMGRTFYIFYGEGRNGKSAVFEILSSVMMHYVKSIEASIIIKRGKKNAGQASPELEVLDYGLRLALLSETDEGEQLNESLIKSISGHDPITYRPLYGKNKNFYCEAKLCMLTNNKPYFKLSQSMIDRLRFLEFKSRFVSCTEEEAKNLPAGQYRQDTQLVQDLKTNYRPYVLLWCAMGAQRFFQEQHMNIPNDEVLKKENLSYINEMDSVKRFVDECLIVEDEGQALCSKVNEAYKKFCNDEKIPAIKPSDLKKILLKQFGKTKASDMKYVGCSIKPEPIIDEPMKKYDLDQ